jgi:DNA mismatch repair protein MutH
MTLYVTTQQLVRKEALRRLNLLAGKNLRPMADNLGLTVWKEGRKNKGWAGQVIKRYLGLALNSLQAPRFWELGAEVRTAAAWGRRHAARQRVNSDHHDRTGGSPRE